MRGCDSILLPLKHRSHNQAIFSLRDPDPKRKNSGSSPHYCNAGAYGIPSLLGGGRRRFYDFIPCNKQLVTFPTSVCLIRFYSLTCYCLPGSATASLRGTKGAVQPCLLRQGLLLWQSLRWRDLLPIAQRILCGRSAARDIRQSRHQEWKAVAAGYRRIECIVVVELYLIVKINLFSYIPLKFRICKL